MPTPDSISNASCREKTTNSEALILPLRRLLISGKKVVEALSRNILRRDPGQANLLPASAISYGSCGSVLAFSEVKR